MKEHLRIRLAAGLLQKIDAACEAEGRTRTGEISRRLAQSFERDSLATEVRSLMEEVRKAEAERGPPDGFMRRADGSLISLEVVDAEWARKYNY